MRILFITTLLFSALCTACSHQEPTSELTPIKLQVKKQQDQIPSVQLIDPSQIKDNRVLRYAPNQRTACTAGSEVYRLNYIDDDETLLMCYDKAKLTLALENAGVSEIQAAEWTYTLFNTAYASPDLLADIAREIGPGEFGVADNRFLGEVFYFLDEGTCLEGCIPTAGPPPGPVPVPLPEIPQQECPDGEIRTIAYLVGVTRDILLPASNSTHIVLKSICDPSFVDQISLDIDEVEALLTPLQWYNLVTGKYSEREVWNLYQHQIAPVLLHNQDEVDPDDPCLSLETAFFRTNYFDNPEGRVGYTVYYVRGAGAIYCGALPEVTD